MDSSLDDARNSGEELHNSRLVSSTAPNHSSSYRGRSFSPHQSFDYTSSFCYLQQYCKKQNSPRRSNNLILYSTPSLNGDDEAVVPYSKLTVSETNCDQLKKHVNFFVNNSFGYLRQQLCKGYDLRQITLCVRNILETNTQDYFLPTVLAFHLIDKLIENYQQNVVVEDDVRISSIRDSGFNDLCHFDHPNLYAVQPTNQYYLDHDEINNSYSLVNTQTLVTEYQNSNNINNLCEIDGDVLTTSWESEEDSPVVENKDNNCDNSRRNQNVLNKLTALAWQFSSFWITRNSGKIFEIAIGHLLGKFSLNIFLIENEFRGYHNIR